MYISYRNLEKEQARSLDYKIDKAVEAVKGALAVCRHRAAIAFSGGKDSTVLWHLIRTHFPTEAERMAVIYGAKEWGCGNFHEATPAKTGRPGLKYVAQQEALQHHIEPQDITGIILAPAELRGEELYYAAIMEERPKPGRGGE